MNLSRSSTIIKTNINRITCLLFLFPLLVFAQGEYEEVNSNKESQGFSLVEKWAMYPGGEKGISEHINTELKYPDQALEDSIQGLVILKYVVQTDGSVSEIEVIESVHPLLDAGARRVIQTMTKWKPAIQRGNPVKSAYEQVFNFKL